eukprot:TRINITY_DN226_c0_g1_i1.p1 TRINITY_DN226_c0_g1~~TRINITY_DN226_c0_g1_i1.p1  ORF type:complete len:495 (-),score=82.31 TRINITY_DN226_c0_g1_i1:8-1492(-)
MSYFRSLIMALEEHGFKYVFQPGSRQVKCIGKGSFGQALIVTDQHEQVFVCKEINLIQIPARDRRSAENEVKLMQTLDHPYIVKLVEAFNTPEKMYIIMEFADGGDLQGYVRDHKRRNGWKPLPEEQVLLWFVQLCLALDYLHNKRVLHRDLKTANIFLTAQGTVKLGDFGFSKRIQTDRMAHTICGTPYYFSPELCQGEPYSNKSDVWSAGVVLYELATFRRPYEANSMPELMKKILYGTFTAMGSDVSPALQALVTAMLIKDAAKRPTIAKLLQHDSLQPALQRCVDGLHVKPKAERYPQINTVLHTLPTVSEQSADDRAAAIRQKIEQQRLERAAAAGAAPPAPTTTPAAEAPVVVLQPQAATDTEVQVLREQIKDLPAPPPEVEPLGEQDYSFIFEEDDDYEEDFEEYDEGGEQQQGKQKAKGLDAFLSTAEGKEKWEAACNVLRERGLEDANASDTFQSLCSILGPGCDELLPFLPGFVIRGAVTNIEA